MISALIHTLPYSERIKIIVVCEKEIRSNSDLNALIKLCLYDIPLYNGFGCLMGHCFVN